ncbi:microtubule-associated protein 10 [Meriones unguiculatus]|uniref:microtubule-associated protein 10 n=1 Tax=Meriones unguiculatus TaxID=10047 RepID=UPI000B4EF9DF|nr:microtubule-associated protein 10 [Meriones unguiculatus]
MAAEAAGRLFSLELLVDWVRLETGPWPCAAGPAVAFRLLDFPPLLVLPPPAASPEPRSGTISFGRGKACLLRLRPAGLRRPRLRAAVLRLPEEPGCALRLLGVCDVLLKACPGQRAVFTLRGPAAERVGELALFYRLTELGRFPPGPGGPLSPGDVLQGSEPRTRESPKPGTRASSATSLQRAADGCHLEAPEPLAEDTRCWCAEDWVPSAEQKAWEEAILHSLASSADISSVSCSPAPSERSASPLSPEATELDFETNTFCPPPLYYTHLTQEKTPSARVEITIEPERNGPESLDAIFPEAEPIGPPAGPVRSAVWEKPSVPLSPPQMRRSEAANKSASPPQDEQTAANAIRHLPLLNALLIELSLLCNQPVSDPSQVHPHLAWLYRGEQHQGPDPPTKSSSQSESKSSKLSGRESEKPSSVQSRKNPKSKRSEKTSGSPPRLPKGKLLYGLTNSLRLRLKQTNPDMLAVHEKREQYRKSQKQAVGPKFRVRSWKEKKGSGLAAHGRVPPQPLMNKSSLSNGSLAEGSDTSVQVSTGFDESNTTKETKGSHAVKKETVDGRENRPKDALPEAPMSSAGPIIPERFPHSNILGGKSMKVQGPGLSQQDPTVDKSADEGRDGGQVRVADIVPADAGGDRPPSRQSSCESISELQSQHECSSLCYSEDFCTSENSRSLPALPSTTGAEKAEQGSQASQLSEAGLFTRKNSSDSGSVLTPAFSAGSPVCSCKSSRVLKTYDSLEDVASLSTSDFLSQWTSEKEDRADPVSSGSSKVVRRCQDSSTKLKAGASHKSSEKSQSPRTSQVSSYEPSHISELELRAVDNSVSSDLQEDEDSLGSLRISKQCRDICELVINKLPGYTV